MAPRASSPWDRLAVWSAALLVAATACTPAPPEALRQPPRDSGPAADSAADLPEMAPQQETRELFGKPWAPAPTHTPYLAVLGIAQDGGIPQAGTKEQARWTPGQRRFVSSIALVDPRANQRFLFDATPDFREQLAMLDAIAPDPRVPGLDGIFVTHAHLGHYLGLAFLGFESIGANEVPVYAMPRFAEYVRNNGPWSQLVRYQNIELRPLADGVPVKLGADLTVTPFLVPHRQEYSEVVGFRFQGPDRSALFIPDINSWEEWDAAGTRIEDALATVDLALLDASFFAQGEIRGRDMTGFPHPLVRATMERLGALAPSERGKVYFTHLNHTNPLWFAESPAKLEVEAAGFHVLTEGQVLPL